MPVVTPYRALSYLALGRQATQNTPVVPATFPVLIEQAFMPTQKITDFRTGNVRDIAFAVKEEFLYAGAFKTFLYANEGAALLAWAMGGDTRTGAADPYTHTLSLVDPLPYLTVEAAFYETQLLDRVGDCKIAKLLIEAEARKEVELTVDLMGGSVAVQGSPIAVTFNNGAGEGPMTFYHGAFTLTGPGDASTLQGVINKLSIELDQDMSPEYGPGAVGPIALVEQGRLITIKLSALFTGDDLHRLVHYGSSSGTSVSGSVGTGSIAATFTSVAAAPGPERSALFTVPNMVWHVSTPMFDRDAKTGMVMAEATGYRSGATLPFSAVFKNGVAAAQISVVAVNSSNGHHAALDLSTLVEPLTVSVAGTVYTADPNASSVLVERVIAWCNGLLSAEEAAAEAEGIELLARLYGVSEAAAAAMTPRLRRTMLVFFITGPSSPRQETTQ